MLLVAVQLDVLEFISGFGFDVDSAPIVDLWWRQGGQRMHLGVLIFRLFLRVLYRLRICPKEQGGRSAF